MLTHYQVQLPAWETALALSGPQLLCAEPEEILPQRFHLNDADLLFVTDDFSALASQPQSKAKVSFQCLWSLVTGESTPANQKPQFLIQSTTQTAQIFEDWQTPFENVTTRPPSSAFLSAFSSSRPQQQSPLNSQNTMTFPARSSECFHNPLRRTPWSELIAARSHVLMSISVLVL